MAHARTTIRGLIVSALTGIATVTANRVHPYFTLPSLNVVTVDEEVTEHLHGLQTRELSVDIEIRVKATDDLDDALDALAVQVETALADGLAGTKDVTLAGTEIEYDDESEQPVGLARLTYIITYNCDPGDPETTL